MTYIRAVLLQFRITPIVTAVNTSIIVFGLFMIPLQLAVTGWFIDSLIEVVQSNYPISIVVPSLLAITALYLYGFVFASLWGILNRRTAYKTWMAIHYPLGREDCNLKAEFYDNEETLDLIFRTTYEPAAKFAGIHDNFMMALLSAGKVISFLVILFASAPFVSVVIFLFIVPCSFIAHKAGKEHYSVYQDTTKLSRMQEGVKDYMGEREHVDERNLFSFSAWLSERFTRISSELLTKNTKVSMRYASKVNLLSLPAIAFCFGALLTLLPRVEAGYISPGHFIALFGVVFPALDSLRTFVDRVNQHSSDQSFLKEFRKFQALERIPNVLDEMVNPPPVFDSLEFRNVSFAYPNTTKQILHNCSFKIEAGKRYALVGSNGSGKTTIVKLVLRMYDNYTGDIFLNERDIKNIPFPELKVMFSVTRLDFEEYNISLAENIAIGAGFAVSDAEIDEAIDIVGLTSEIAHLPDGKNTLTGKLIDGATELSQGQWQRIALARAVVSKAGLKILDEPTAALDPMAERDVYFNFDKISQESATLFISHRLASAKMADTVYVLEDGAIVETGHHDDLMSKDTLYKKMFDSQSEWYQ